jgi:GAF domain-containing protein
VTRSHLVTRTVDQPSSEACAEEETHVSAHEVDGREPEDGLWDGGGDLFTLLLAERPLDAVVALAELSCRAIPGCSEGSVTRTNGGGAYTAAATSRIADEIDQAQYRSNSGPCLDALREQRIVAVAAMDDDGGYWQFRAAAIERGVHSSISVPVTLNDRPLGALNLYSQDTDGFGHDARDIAARFAALVSAAISDAERRERTQALIQQLEAGLRSRDVIGQAKGIVMLQEQVDEHAAFEILLCASQHRNIKLRDIAHEVIRTNTKRVTLER